MFRWFSGLRVVLRSVFRRRHVDEELDREMQYHLDRQIDEGVKAGLSPEEARYAALREMGTISKSKEECRDARGVRFIDDATMVNLIVRHQRALALRRLPTFRRRRMRDTPDSLPP